MGVNDYVDTHDPNGVDDLTILIQVCNDTVLDNENIHIAEQAYSKQSVYSISKVFTK